MSETPAGIDPRAPRFGAAITSVLLVVTIVLSLTGLGTARGAFGWFAYQPLPGTTFGGHGGYLLPSAPLWLRVVDPAFLVLLVIAAIFLWSVLSPRTAPWGAVFRRFVRPRLAPPAELEDPRPPRFAQAVGLTCAVIGLVLQLAGVPWGLAVAAGVTFIASFLNAAFGFCLGCQMYLLLQRAGVIGRAAA